MSRERRELIRKRLPLHFQPQSAAACAAHVDTIDAVVFRCHSPAFNFQHPAKLSTQNSRFRRPANRGSECCFLLAAATEPAP
ncbi:hypothetical protein DFH06DRAFT_1329197 [Mycena polygramma]|nr:hypothetical protein DFH06DRAFT_1329197 [Mycena polygramma]